jgi:hypothetical protein
VACALELQRAPLAPIQLRIGVHTGEVQLRDEANYIGATINRAARIRDLAHGGQTVLSGTTEDLVADVLPADAWLTDLGRHELRDLPRPERVVQLCHPDLRNDFPPLRTAKSVGAHNLPVQLTSFVGREAEMHEVRQLLSDNRLVTLTGAGGAGKTRLAVEITARIAPEFRDGVWYVDLAPITHPAVVPVTVARALGLPDQPGRSTMDMSVVLHPSRRGDGTRVRDFTLGETSPNTLVSAGPPCTGTWPTKRLAHLRAAGFGNTACTIRPSGAVGAASGCDCRAARAL